MDYDNNDNNGPQQPGRSSPELPTVEELMDTRSGKHTLPHTSQPQPSEHQILASSEEDLKVVEHIATIYTSASNARFNADKYEWIRVGKPSFTPPKCPLDPPSPVRHLGILMNTQGVDIKANLKLLKERITRTANWIGQSKVSIRARAISLNTFALSEEIRKTLYPNPSKGNTTSIFTIEA
jgi:hypothetical protein